MKKIIFIIAVFLMPLTSLIAQGKCACQDTLSIAKCFSKDFVDSYTEIIDRGGIPIIVDEDEVSGGTIKSREFFARIYKVVPIEKKEMFLEMFSPETVKYVKENHHKFANPVIPTLDLQEPEHKVGRLTIPSGLKKGERSHFEKVNKILDKKGIK
jgi:hypothetical protein